MKEKKPSNFNMKELTMFKKRFILAVLTAALLTLPAAANNDAQKDEDETPMVTEVVEVVGNVPVVKTIQSVSIFKNEEMKKHNFESLKSVLRVPLQWMRCKR